MEPVLMRLTITGTYLATPGDYPQDDQTPEFMAGIDQEVAMDDPYSAVEWISDLTVTVVPA